MLSPPISSPVDPSGTLPFLHIESQFDQDEEIRQTERELLNLEDLERDYIPDNESDAEQDAGSEASMDLGDEDVLEGSFGHVSTASVVFFDIPI